MLLWYSKNHDTLLKKPCDDAGTKVNITELLLTCQAKRIFLQFKNEIMSKEPEAIDPSKAGQPEVNPAQKRDSFSDSGQDSGHNTPTRGRTINEGLLRLVQDSSVVRPPHRQASVDMANLSLMRPNLTQPASIIEAAQYMAAQAQTPGHLPPQLQTIHLGQHQANNTGYVLQNQTALLQQQLQQLQQQQAPAQYTITSLPNVVDNKLPPAQVPGRESVPLLTNQLSSGGRESVPLVINSL